MSSISVGAVPLTTIHQTPTYLFQGVKGNNEHMDYVAKIMKEQLAPLYGDQTRAIEKIREGIDRRAMLFYENQTPVGLLVYKKKLTNEFKEYKIKKSLEVKTLFVINPEENSGRGLGTKLLNKVTEIAKKEFARSIHVTVSSQKKTSKDFFQKKGFAIQKVWNDKYMKGSTEYLLKRDVEKSESNVILHKMPKQKRKRKEATSRTTTATESSKKRREEVQMPKLKKQRTERAESRAVSPQRTEREVQTHQFPLKGHYIQHIRRGTKTIEGRINSGGFKKVREGDLIKFFNNTGEVWTKVLEKRIFNSFRAMLEETGVQNCLPGETSVERGVSLYNSFPGYSRKVKQFGAVSLLIKVVEKPEGQFSNTYRGNGHNRRAYGHQRNYSRR